MAFEEWWGRTFEGRGQMHPNQMSDLNPKSIRKLDTKAVLELIRSEDTRSVRGLLAHMERNRRENWTSRFAVSISLLSLLIALASLTVAVTKQ